MSDNEKEIINQKYTGETIGFDRVVCKDFAQCNPDTRNCHLCNLSDKCIMFTLFKAMENKKEI